jgi:hypothetical protein
MTLGLAGKDDILKVASYEDRINVHRSNIASINDFSRHHAVKPSFKQFEFTTTVFHISRMVSKDCTRVQYTAREYIHKRTV